MPATPAQASRSTDAGKDRPAPVAQGQPTAPDRPRRPARRYRDVLPQRTMRFRLTALYGGLFLVSGTALLAITYLLVGGLPLAPPPHYQPPAVSGNLPAAIAYERSAALHALLLRSGLALVIMTIVSIWLGWVMAGRALGPLRIVTARTREISEENLHERLALEGPRDEVTELSDTIDGLLGRLEGSFESQRSFVANASHELRTPLAMMRTSLDVAAAKPRPMSDDAAVLSAKVREGLDQADRLVESFLVLARAQGQALTAVEPVSLAELITAGLGSQAEAITQRGLMVRASLSPAGVSGVRMLLARLVSNLIDNAVRHNAPHGFIEVRTEYDGHRARLSVDNGGRMIAPEHAAALAEPFRRLGSERTGSANGVGLGLAIVAAIAAAHHGTLTLEARPEGGLRAVVELPAGQPPSGSRRGE